MTLIDVTIFENSESASVSLVREHVVSFKEVGEDLLVSMSDGKDYLIKGMSRLDFKGLLNPSIWGMLWN